MSISYLIRPATTLDAEVIRASWRNSYATSPLTASAKTIVYNVFISCWMEHWLSRSTVFVASPDNWEAGVLGWCAAEQTTDRFLVHYCFTKPDFRRSGIMRALLSKFEPQGELVFSSLVPPSSDHLRNLGYRHDPRVASQFRVTTHARHS